MDEIHLPNEDTIRSLILCVSMPRLKTYGLRSSEGKTKKTITPRLYYAMLDEAPLALTLC